ncbi:MAG: ABC transporter ATP-binding protein [Eubacteriales bacterium]|nr:ABC transporter ATP-binding protein [Eubacteriales bacterium]
MSVAIDIKDVCKKYENLTIIPQLSAHIQNGEFFTLLGPSGCGKTTLLRMIAGFNSIEAGEIAFDETVINNLPAHKRNIGMVFQSYAIFPHLTVEENVAYGLKIRKEGSKQIKEKVDKILKLIKIDEYRDRLPSKLSGGQQQRVALARAIVIHPKVLLMDEPLSNLDAKLRIEMRSVIKDIQHQIGITTVYVTHDQEEALAISDRIAVMNHGEIQQIDSPENIYSRPFNVFVACFIGHSNLFKATVSMGEQAELLFANGYRLPMQGLANVKDGQEVIVGVRPEEFSVAKEGLPCTIKSNTFLGRYNNYFLDFEDTFIVPNQASIEFSQDLGHADTMYRPGNVLYLVPNAKKINVFDATTQESLIKDVPKYA